MKKAGRSIGAIVGGLMLIGATCAFAADWPQWRGANRDGKVTGFTAPENWPKAEVGNVDIIGTWPRIARQEQNGMSHICNPCRWLVGSGGLLCPEYATPQVQCTPLCYDYSRIRGRVA